MSKLSQKTFNKKHKKETTTSIEISDKHSDGSLKIEGFTAQIVITRRIRKSHR